MIALDFAAVLVEWPLLLQGRGLDACAHRRRGAHRRGARRRLRAGRARTAPARLRWAVGAYVELIRNTPFIVQLFFVFFGLPAAGRQAVAEPASVIAMVINLGAYAAEIIRAGIEATPRGQIEAARSLALNERAGLHARGAAAGAAARSGRRW